MLATASPGIAGKAPPGELSGRAGSRQPTSARSRQASERGHDQHSVVFAVAMGVLAQLGIARPVPGCRDRPEHLRRLRDRGPEAAAGSGRASRLRCRPMRCMRTDGASMGRGELARQGHVPARASEKAGPSMRSVVFKTSADKCISNHTSIEIQ